MKKEWEQFREAVEFHGGSHTKIFINAQTDCYGPHWHIPLEAVMPLEGGYTAVCGELCQKLEEGDIALIAPGAVHALEAPPRGRRLFLQADISCFAEIQELDSLFLRLPPLVVLRKDHASAIYEDAVRCMERICAEHKAGHAFTELSIYSELFRLLTLAGRYFACGQAEGESGNPGIYRYKERILHSCSYIKAHLEEPLTLEQAAAASGFSKYHFAHIFREFMGISFYQYLNQKRMDNAQMLLANPDCTVTEAAMLSGFTSISSFNRMFRKCRGCTPTMYRERYFKIRTGSHSVPGFPSGR